MGVDILSAITSFLKFIIGYYRVNYDEKNWKLIIKQLNEDHTKIHVINRAQIIDDALNLARVGLLNYELALGVTSYLNSETEYIPWAAALTGLRYIEEMLKRTSGYGDFKVSKTRKSKNICFKSFLRVKLKVD